MNDKQMQINHKINKTPDFIKKWAKLKLHRITNEQRSCKTWNSRSIWIWTSEFGHVQSRFWIFSSHNCQGHLKLNLSLKSWDTVQGCSHLFHYLNLVSAICEPQTFRSQVDFTGNVFWIPDALLDALSVIYNLFLEQVAFSNGSQSPVGQQLHWMPGPGLLEIVWRKQKLEAEENNYI